MKTTWLLPVLICVSALSLISRAQTTSKVPFFQKKDGCSQLIIGGKPFIMLSGELHNSSASSLNYMDPIWNRLVSMNLNTVIATVSWELIEPAEEKFDFSLVDGIIKSAREHKLKLVLIWFGTWKNAWSTYVPVWVKNDLNRFPRMQLHTGENAGALSAFGENSVKADANAYAKLMHHIRQIDAEEQTVIMMQVENETGVLGGARDRNLLAEKLFTQPVPEELYAYLKKNKTAIQPALKRYMASEWRTGATWKEIFGLAADEVFQAWFTAGYVEKVVAAGKAEYNLPMYVNAWIDPNFADSLKTEYPSGGPVYKVFDIWRAAAPSVDFYAPDIYLDDFKKVCNSYNQSGNILFIPENQSDARVCANVYYAIGQHNAIGYSPFGIDGITDINSISLVYGSLNGFLPFFAQHQGLQKNVGLLYTGNKNETIELGGYKIKITYTQTRDQEKNRGEAAGIILNTSAGEFYIAGFGFNANFETIDHKGWVEILSHDEGTFDNGTWKPERRMNGDEMEIIMMAKPSIRKVWIHTIY